MEQTASFDSGPQTFADGHRHLASGARHHDEELFAAEPPRAVTVPDIACDDLADRTQATVAGKMAEPVVDRFEVVDVEQ